MAVDAIHGHLEVVQSCTIDVCGFCIGDERGGGAFETLAVSEVVRVVYDEPLGHVGEFDDLFGTGLHRVEIFGGHGVENYLGMGEFLVHDLARVFNGLEV